MRMPLPAMHQPLMRCKPRQPPHLGFPLPIAGSGAPPPTGPTNSPSWQRSKGIFHLLNGPSNERFRFGLLLTRWLPDEGFDRRALELAFQPEPVGLTQILRPDASELGFH